MESYLWNHGAFNFDFVVVQALNECVHNLVSRATHECCRRACLLLIALLLVNYFRCHSSLSRSFYFQCIVVAFSLILLQWISKYLVQMFECHKFTHKRWCRYRLFANALIWRISSTGSLLGEGIRLRFYSCWPPVAYWTSWAIALCCGKIRVEFVCIAHMVEERHRALGSQAFCESNFSEPSSSKTHSEQLMCWRCSWERDTTPASRTEPVSLSSATSFSKVFACTITLVTWN